MRTVLGPHPIGSLAAAELAFLDKAFVSAVELADIAIKLARLKRLKEPDVAGAIELLKQTLVQRNGLTPLACAGLHLVLQGHAPVAVRVVSTSGPVDKNFPGAELIRVPKRYPLGYDEAVRLISGEYSRKRRMGFRLRMINTTRQAMGLAPVAAGQLPKNAAEQIEDESDFWELAKRMAPFCPRFAKLDKQPKVNRPERKTPSARSRKSSKGKKGS